MTTPTGNTAHHTHVAQPMTTSYTEGLYKCIHSCATNLVRLAARVLTIAMIVIKHVSGVFIAVGAKVFELATAPYSGSISRREREELQRAIQVADDEQRRLGQLPPDNVTPVVPFLSDLAPNFDLTEEEQLALMYLQNQQGGLTEEEEVEIAMVESRAQIDQARRGMQQNRSQATPSPSVVGPLLSPVPQPTVADSLTVPQFSSAPLDGLSLLTSPQPHATDSSTPARVQFCRQEQIDQNKAGTAYLSRFVDTLMSGPRDRFSEVQTSVFAAVQSHQRRSEQQASFFEDCKVLAEMILTTYLEAPDESSPFINLEMDTLSHQTFKQSFDDLSQFIFKNPTHSRGTHQKERLITRLAQNTQFMASVDGLFQ